MSTRTVRRWLAAGLPRRADGSYDVEEVRAWRAETKARSAANGGHSRRQTGLRLHQGIGLSGRPLGEQGRAVETATAETVDGDTIAGVNRLKARKLAAEAQLKELQAAEQKGDLVRRDAVADLLLERGRYFRRELEAAARSLGPEVAAETDPVRCELLITEHVQRVIAEAYERVPERYR